MEVAVSFVYQLLPKPDWATTTTVAVPDDSAHDAAGWARAVFAVGSVPSWVKVMFGVREVVARLMGIPSGRGAFTVREVRAGEALMDTDERHLRFVAGVQASDGLLHVTTAVRLKGWRGQLYFWPVRFLHDQITRSMMTAAVRRAAGRRPATPGI
jgi:hypothetical protein